MPAKEKTVRQPRLPSKARDRYFHAPAGLTVHWTRGLPDSWHPKIVLVIRASFS